MKTSITILGINIIETFNEEEFKYLDGFCIISNNHNFASELRKTFFHQISFDKFICRIQDVATVFQNTIKRIIASNSFLGSLSKSIELHNVLINEFKFRIGDQLNYFSSQIKGNFNY